MRPSPDRLERDVDLNDVAGGDGFLFVRDGVGFAGRGVAARVPVDEALGVLAAIEHDDDVGGAGTGPIALGALPFLPGAPGELVIPRGRRRQGRRTAARGSPGSTAPSRARSTRPPPARAAGVVRAPAAVDVDHYLAAVASRRATRCAPGGSTRP